MTSILQEINNNEMKIEQLRHENEKLKRDYVKQRFSVEQRCRVFLEFDDGHNGAPRSHELLGRVSEVSDEGVYIWFDKPYRCVPEILLACRHMFSKYCDVSFFTMQGFAHVYRVTRIRRVRPKNNT
jgi:hypothetical protein